MEESKELSSVYPANEIAACIQANRVIRAYGPLEKDTVSSYITNLRFLARGSDSATVLIQSPGGSLSAVRNLERVVDKLRQESGFKLYTLTEGDCFSAAIALMLIGDGDGIFAKPDASFQYHGSIKHIVDSDKEYSQLAQEVRIAKMRPLIDKISRRTRQSLEEVTYDLANDRIFTAQEALNVGLIDGIYEK